MPASENSERFDYGMISTRTKSLGAPETSSVIVRGPVAVARTVEPATGFHVSKSELVLNW